MKTDDYPRILLRNSNINPNKLFNNFNKGQDTQITGLYYVPVAEPFSFLEIIINKPYKHS